MKFSENWLREWVDPQISTTQLLEQLTMAGLEVDAVEPVAAVFSDVVVAEIVSAKPHPDADKLQVCEVSTGQDVHQVVCGASNARAGLRVPLALVGASLPGGLEIKRAKLRGVESSGMLCAEQELGMAAASDGLLELAADAPLGATLRDYLQLDDQAIEVDLTPNRADCLSVAGIAREAAVLNNMDASIPAINSVVASTDSTLDVDVEAASDCPRYVSRVIEAINLKVASPQWLQERLRRSGLRSIDPVVDVTNYVMLELGQPMHAFDRSKVRGGIVVRLARTDEKLVLLDGQELSLQTDSLVIADHERALALAGIMGGKDSGIDATTKNIVLEAAYFAPNKIAGRARYYGLHTDSSHRFERGVDFELQRKAMERATALLLDIVGGKAGPIVEKVHQQELPEQQQLLLRESRIHKVLGFSLPKADVTEMLTRLGMDPDLLAEGWRITVPSYRFDIAIEADLLEEIARIYGYNRLPVTVLNMPMTLKQKPEQQLPQSLIRQQLVALGYQEAICYSFVEPKLQRLLEPALEPLALTNPISNDLSVMRSNLLGGLITAAKYNLNRQQLRIRLFETGLTFKATDSGIKQDAKVAGLITGSRSPEGPHGADGLVDFYDIKGHVESILALSGQPEAFSFDVCDVGVLHPGQSAKVIFNGREVGVLGLLHPQVSKLLDVAQDVFVFELEFSAAISRKSLKFNDISKYPEVRRDIAIVVDRKVTVGEISEIVRMNSGEWLEDLILFDIYMGKGIDPQRKSLAFGLTFRHSSRTLNEEEINVQVEQIINVLVQRYDATLRN